MDPVETRSAKYPEHFRVTEEIVRLLSVRKDFAAGLDGEHFTAVSDVSFSVSPGEVVCICGKTGCGKSTLVNLLLGIDAPTAGEIQIDGLSPEADFMAMRGKLAAVFQGDRLLPWRNVIDNAAIGLEVAGLSREKRHAQTSVWLAKVGLAGWEEAYPHQLSGGMRQRVAIARAFVMDPMVILLDEAFGHLDEVTAHKLREDAMTLYHRAECLTHVGDSQAVRSLTQCGEPMRFAMAAPIDLRNDFDSVSLRRLAKRTRDATQSRRLLALAEVYDGGSRTDASRIGGVGLQIIRDWVLRFNARGLDGLVDGKSPGAPSKLNADHRRALAEVVEAGPVPAVDGVVRWRRKDLARWLLETFAISLDETTVGRELKALGFAKISARPRHYAQNELAVEAFKKNFPAELAKIRARLPKGVEIELWWQDEARIGQKNKLTRRWARRGTRPRAPRDQRTEWAYIFGAICPAKGKGAGLVMPWCDTDAMAAHLIEISAAVDPGAQAVLIVDQAGWHLTPKLAIPDNITVLALPPRSPELNPVENVWQFMRDNWLSNRIFKSYEDIVALCCQAWNNLIDQPWKIMSLGMRKWAHGF